MRKIRCVLGAIGILATLAVLCFALIGCGKADPAYVGQWLFPGMGNEVFNFRADGTYSDINWGTIGDNSTLNGANRGTYSFTPNDANDPTTGTIHLHITEECYYPAKTWSVIAPIDHNWPATVVPKTSFNIHGTIFQYYGPEAPIPANFD